MIVSDDRRGAIERLAADWSLPPGQIEQSPSFLIGSVDEIAERLQELRERFGSSHVSIVQWDVQDFGPVVGRLAGREAAVMACRLPTPVAGRPPG